LYNKAEKVQGCLHVNLSNEFTPDDLHKYHNKFQLIIFLDQHVGSYDFIETYRTLDINLTYLKKNFPVMMPGDDLVWTNLYQYNQYKDKNLVIELEQFESAEECASTLKKIHTVTSQNNCNWLTWRARRHETFHYEITKQLLKYDNFVLLTPDVFENFKPNLQIKVYNHWFNFYLKKICA